MSKPDPNLPPNFKLAGERESGVPCVACEVEIALKESCAICTACGAVHHQTCWEERGRCQSYDCAAEAIGSESTGVPLKITSDELSTVTPLPVVKPASFTSAGEQHTKRKWNRTSLWAFAVALLGIPLFGLITGLIAILLACIALVTHRENRRGMGFAVAAMLIGLLDVVGWAYALSHFSGPGQRVVSLADMTFDPASLDELPEDIMRAMRANVLLQVGAGFGQGGIGSGVVLKVADGSAFIITNRHVVDHKYSDATRTAPVDLSKLGRVTVQTLNQVTRTGVVEWLAPHGIDLAIVSAPLSHLEVLETKFNPAAKPQIGDGVFAIGNPHGLGWSHTAGSISQIRQQNRGGFSYKVLQTSTPINLGNSGGGLYDAEGNLVGINTLTAEKRFAEGLSFSIALQTLVDVVPAEYTKTDPQVEEASP